MFTGTADTGQPTEITSFNGVLYMNGWQYIPSFLLQKLFLKLKNLYSSYNGSKTNNTNKSVKGGNKNHAINVSKY